MGQVTIYLEEGIERKMVAAAKSARLSKSKRNGQCFEEKAHVGVTPGIDFGPNGEGYLRFSYANSLENSKEGLDRLESYIAQMTVRFA